MSSRLTRVSEYRRKLQASDGQDDEDYYRPDEENQRPALRTKIFNLTMLFLNAFILQTRNCIVNILAAVEARHGQI